MNYRLVIGLLIIAVYMSIIINHCVNILNKVARQYYTITDELIKSDKFTFQPFKNRIFKQSAQSAWILKTNKCEYTQRCIEDAPKSDHLALLQECLSARFVISGAGPLTKTKWPVKQMWPAN